MLNFNKLVSKWIINSNINSKPSRPFPFSMYSYKKKVNKIRVLPADMECGSKLGDPLDWEVSNYTSWENLTNKEYSNRLLAVASQEHMESLPPIEKVVGSFLRKGKPMKPCHRSSILFMGFAQWFTDAFLRIDLNDIRKNTSNHEIDLCQIYGLNKVTTEALRSKIGGRLKTQLIKGKEFPPFLFDENLEVIECFKELEYISYLPRIYGDLWKDTDKRKNFFATGLGRGNSTITHTAINLLFIRLHNKVAGLLEHEYDWNDEQLFETTRNILIVMLIRITIEDYVNHIKPFKWMSFVFDNSFAERKKWYRNNWISTEFNLAYRWHSLIPDAFTLNGKIHNTVTDFRFNNAVIIENELSSLFNQMSFQKAGEISLENTPDFMYFPEISGLHISRASRLLPFTAYNKEFRSKLQKLIKKEPIKKIEDITKNKKLQQTLKNLYGNDVHKIDLLVGLLAEDPPNSLFYNHTPILGTTMLNMIASDAFSHALTNPLLSEKVFNKATFSPLGLDLIDKFNSVKGLVEFVEETKADISFNYNEVSKQL